MAGEKHRPAASTGGASDATWLDERRAARWYIAVMLGTLVMTATTLYSSYVDPQAFGDELLAPDFASFWAAGVLLGEGKPLLAYDWETHQAVIENSVARALNAAVPWIYPPHALVLTAPLPLGTLWISMAVFVVVQTAFFVFVCWRILPHRLTPLVAVATPAFVVTVVNGQTGMWFAAFLGLTLLYRRRFPLLSGTALGFLTFKPNLFGVVALPLLVERSFRPLVWATVFFAALVAVSLAIGGPTIWEAFLANVERTMEIHSSGGVSFAVSSSLFGFLRYFGVEVGPAMSLHIGVALPALAAMILAFRDRRLPEDVKAALLCYALYVFAPRSMIYEQHVLLVGALFQVRHALAAGFFPYERVILLGALAAGFASLGFLPGMIPLLAPLLTAALVWGRWRPVWGEPMPGRTADSAPSPVPRSP